jgi:ankyrin repeat protein
MDDSMPARLNRAIVSPGRVGADLAEMQRLLAAEPGLANQACGGGTNAKYPLTEAAERGNVEAVKLLIAAGANVNAANQKGRTALHTVAAFAFMQNGKPAKVVTTLIAAGADVNARDGNGHTPLRDVVMNRKSVNLEIAKALIAAGADVNATDNLRIASRSASPEIVKALITAGAKVNVVMPGGTPLIEAAAENRADNVTVLLENGVNVNLRLPADHENAQLAGKTALDVARERKAKKVIPLLEAAAASPPPQS